MKRKTVGIVALQGAVTPHVGHCEAAGLAVREVRKPEDLKGCDGLILPGGESSTMLKLMGLFGLTEPLAAFFERKPVWGICAGCILLAREVSRPAQWSFGVLDIAVERNAYGSQIQSHGASVGGYPVCYIRAPIIRRTGDVDVLATHRGTATWVRHARAMATTFHPELTVDVPSPMHVLFAQMLKR